MMRYMKNIHSHFETGRTETRSLFMWTKFGVKIFPVPNLCKMKFQIKSRNPNQDITHVVQNCIVAKSTTLTWNITTRPPLSPVASNSPSWLNSTQEIISASVTSSSKAPFICEKHHDLSPFPAK